MALHDYVCRICGGVLQDVYRSVNEGAQAHPPLHCGIPTDWIPQVQAMDAKEPMQEFTVMDGRNQPVVIDSLHRLRQVERESEQQARNGEGQQMVWRAYSQNRGNRLDHSIAPPPDQSVPQAAKEKFGLGRAARALEGEPDRPFGPGVHQGNTSALPTDPF